MYERALDAPRRRFSSLRWLALASIALWVSFAAPPATAAGITIDRALVPYADGDHIEIVVPFAPGGGFDAYARLFAPYFEEAMENLTGARLNVIVRNQPGAGGQIGHQAVYNAAPDGRTLLVSHGGAVQTFDILYGLPISPDRYTYIASFGQWIKGIVVRANLNISGLRELLAYAERNQLRIGTAGIGDDTHVDLLLIRELWEQAGQPFNIRFVHHEGTGPAMAAMARGEVDVIVTSITTLLTLINDGDGTLISVLAPQRYYRFPDVPTLLEEGVPAAEEIVAAMYASRDLIGPPGIPALTRDLLTAAAFIAMNNASFRADAARANLDLLYMTGFEARERSLAKRPILIRYEALLSEALGI